MTMPEMVRRLSPNQGTRGRHVPSMIVLHCDASAKEASTLDWLSRDVSAASYHVFVARDGTAYRLVDDERRAWHAGKSAFPGYVDVNSQSLGLSWANRHDDTEPLTPAQVAVGKSVIAAWRAKYAIRDIVTHADVAPKRKEDPNRVLGFNIADWR